MIDDLQAIKNLVYSYAELLDVGDLESMGMLFEHAVVRVHGSTHEFGGAQAVQSLIAQTVRLYDGIPNTKHVVSNLIVEMEPNEPVALARSYYVALQATADHPLQPILAGRWHDRLQKVDGRWRFAERVIYNDLVGDISAHLAGPA